MGNILPKIEGIIIDFDGTLAGVSHTVSPRVKEVIEKARKEVKISLCTGRPYKFVAALARDLGLDTLHVAEGGARVIDAQEKIYWERLIDPPTVRALFAMGEEEGMECLAQIEGNDMIGWTPLSDEPLPAIAHMIFHSPDRAKTEEILARTQKRFSSIHAILTHYQDREDTPVMWGVDITVAGANKQHALLHLAQMEGLDLKKFMAIGDGHNDFPLLMACGFKVAMGNAHPELKAIADYVAPSVDEEGVAHIIEKFVLE